MEQVEQYQPSEGSHDPKDIDSVISRVSTQVERAQRKDKALNNRPLLRQYLKLTRPGFLLDHLDVASLRVVSRTYFQFIATVIIALIVPANNWLGSTPYLIVILGVWDPPGGFSVFSGIFMALCHIFLVGSSLVFFLVTNAICWRIHGYQIPAQVYALYPECTDNLCLTEALLDGRFLNVRVVAVTLFGVFFCLAFHSYISSYRPFMRFSWFAGMMPILIMAPEAAHIPLWEPWTRARSVVLGFGFAAIFKAVLCCTFSPFSSSEKIVGQLGTLLLGLRKTATEMFANEDTDPTAAGFGESMSKFSLAFENQLKKTRVLALDMVVCRYEITYSRFDWHDVHELANRAKSLGNLLYNFRFAYIELNDRASSFVSSAVTPQTSVTAAAAEARDSDSDSSAEEQKWRKRHLGKTYKLAGYYEQIRHQEFVAHARKARPFNQSELRQMFAMVTQRYQPLRDACTDCVVTLEQWFRHANQFRLWSLLSRNYRAQCREHQRAQQRALQAKLDNIIELYDELSARADWATETLLKDGQSAGTRSYMMSYAMHYGFITKEYARHVRNLAKWCLYLDETQPEAKWMVGAVATSRESKFRATEQVMSTHLDMDTPDDFVAYMPPKSTQVRDPDATPPRNLLHYIFLKLFVAKQRFWSSRVKYAIKVGATGLVPLVPFFVRHSLRFVHNHRGIWVAIICMISVNENAADCAFGLISRLAASATGCVVGIVCWYVSAQGNPYGLGVMLGALGIVIAYFRHFNTTGGAVMNIVLCLTIIQVTIGSYSVVNNPAASLTFMKDGAWLALYRFLTVNIGIVIAFICTLLPDFTTTKQIARMRLGANLARIGEIKGDLQSYSFQRYDDPHVRRKIYKDVIINKIRAGFHQSRTIGDQLGMLRYEPPLTGYWPKHQYKLFLELELQLLHMMPLFYTLITRIQDRANLPLLLECMGWTNPHLISSFNSVVHMSSEAIQRALPLPTITPGHISADYQLFKAKLFESRGRIGLSELELSKTHDGKLVLVAMILAEQFYDRIDGLLLIIKSLVGEYGDIDPRLWEGFV